MNARSWMIALSGSLLVSGSLGCVAAAGGDDAAGTSAGHDADTQSTCYVAFVHGRGDDRRGQSQEELETYWTSAAGNTDDSLTYAAAESRGCRVLRVGYDGHQAYWDDQAAGTVADQLAAFIDEHSIPDDRLIVIGHSMGALVLRFLMNNGEEGSPYQDYHGHPFSKVVAKTRHFVTIQGPHTGVEIADALFGEADTWYSDGAAAIVSQLGLEKGDGAADSMRRINLEYASASGGWLADGGRTRRMYTVAGTRADSTSGAGWKNDVLLNLAWGAVCHHPHAINLWLCRTIVPGDGLVEERSAAGRIMRGGSAGGDAGERSWEEEDAVQGARTDWIHVGQNHNHGRMNHLVAAVRDEASGETHDAAIGDYLGDHALSLRP